MNPRKQSKMWTYVYIFVAGTKQAQIYVGSSLWRGEPSTSSYWLQSPTWESKAQIYIGLNRQLGDTCILEPPKVGLIEVGDLSSGVGGGWYEIEGAALGIADDQTEVSCAPRHG